MLWRVVYMMKLIEESRGSGELVRDGETIRRVRYEVSRYQGMMEGSGLPVPGLFKIEGSIDGDFTNLIGVPLGLRLEDTRLLAIIIVGPDGRILSEGHGPMKCGCC